MGRAIGLALTCWGMIFVCAALGVGIRDAAMTPGVLLLCLLLILAPAALALPAGRALRAPLWAAEVIVAWALLGYLVLLVDPAALGRGRAFALLIPAAFGALASPALLIAAWRAPARAASLRRQGYLLASLPAGLLLLRGLDALAPPIVALFALLLVAAQVLLWSTLRNDGPVAGTMHDGPTRTLAPVDAPPAATEPPIHLRPVIATVGRARLE